VTEECGPVLRAALAVVGYVALAGLALMLAGLT